MKISEWNDDLWRSDGTDAGTFFLKNLDNGNYTNSLEDVAGTLFLLGDGFFVNDDGIVINPGRELWNREASWLLQHPLWRSGSRKPASVPPFPSSRVGELREDKKRSPRKDK